MASSNKTGHNVGNAFPTSVLSAAYRGHMVGAYHYILALLLSHVLDIGQLLPYKYNSLLLYIVLCLRSAASLRTVNTCLSSDLECQLSFTSQHVKQPQEQVLCLNKLDR